MYEMKPEYYTGIEAIDQEHSRLFDMAQETQDLLGDNLLYDKTEKLNSLMQFAPDSLEDREKQDEIVEKLLGFLITWLIDHIQRADMVYANSVRQ